MIYSLEDETNQFRVTYIVATSSTESWREAYCRCCSPYRFWYANKIYIRSLDTMISRMDTVESTRDASAIGEKRNSLDESEIYEWLGGKLVDGDRPYVYYTGVRDCSASDAPDVSRLMIHRWLLYESGVERWHGSRLGSPTIQCADRLKIVGSKIHITLFKCWC